MTLLFLKLYSNNIGLQFGLVLDDISITHLTFGREFTNAVELKQVAQQEAEKARYKTTFTFFYFIVLAKCYKLICSDFSSKKLSRQKKLPSLPLKVTRKLLNFWQSHLPRQVRDLSNLDALKQPKKLHQPCLPQETWCTYPKVNLLCCLFRSNRRHR